MKNKLPFYSAALTLFFVTIWVVIMIIDLSQEGEMKSFEEVYNYISKLSFGYFLTYVSATFFTITNVILFICFYYIFRQEYPLASLIGILFIPIYGTLNVIAYFSQVTFIPELLELEKVTHQQEIVSFALQQFTQMAPDSFMAFINGLAYALLGIPSIIYGYFMFKHKSVIRTTGILIALSGALSILGMIGGAMNSSVLEKGILFGGFVFWLALIPLTFVLWKPEQLNINV